MEGKDHNLILGICFIVEFIAFALMAIVMAILFVVMIGVGLSQTDEYPSLLLNSLVLLVVFVLQILFPVVFGIAGWKMLKRKKNIRVWGIIASIISLPALIPFGFFIGIYGLWFFISDTGKQFCDSVNVSDQNPGIAQIS